MTDDLSAQSSAAAADAAGLTGPVPQSVAGAQLTQIRVPLEDAAEVLATPDALGRLPIVLLPAHALRIRTGPLIAGVLSVIIGVVIDVTWAARGGLVILGGVLIVLALLGAFTLRVPEGAQAVALRSGRYFRTIGPGNHITPPWIVVSHLVTTRETPFD